MKTALISVYDKSGVVELAQELKQLGWQLLSTGGTYKTLSDAGLEVVEVSSLTQFPELFSGRVKTLHPKIFGGILYRRENEQDVSDVKANQLPSIDLVVNTLYPFEETIKKENITLDQVIEQIDVGGPSMIRAAAKNFKDVTIITDPSDYPQLIEQLKQNGNTTLEQRQYYAMKAFSVTAYYDALISQYFNELNHEQLPETLVLGYKRLDSLRYGENPHQQAASYVKSEVKPSFIMAAKQLHGKALSFNNIYDANGAVKIVKEFSEPTAVAIKHANPCGVGSADNIFDAYQKAYECDTESIFGGIVALNRPVEKDLAEKLSEIFLEIVIAPKFTDEALEVLTKKKNIRLLELDTLQQDHESLAYKQVEGGLLVQETDVKLHDKFETVTDLSVDEQTKKDLEFSWKVAKHISSNGVVLVKDNATIGLGLGFVNRYFATQEALLRAGKKAQGAVLGSDGFFPFPDSMQALGAAGVKAVIQPGGSIKDNEVIKEANNQKIAMVLTGMRHFRH